MAKGVVITVANQKGGVGKTTCTYALAECKAKAGKKTLMIDMDPQCSLTVRLGIDCVSDETYQEKNSCNLYEKQDAIFTSCFPVNIKKPEYLVQEYLGLIGEAPAKTPKKMYEGIIDNLFIMPSHPDLSAYGKSDIPENIKKSKNRTYVASKENMKKNIEELALFFDYIFIDCGPELGELLVGPILYSNKIIMPVIPEVNSYDGLVNVYATIASVKYPNEGEIGNPDLEVSGVIINKYIKNLTHHKAYLAKAIYEKRNILGIVPQTTKVLNAMDNRLPVTIAYPTAEVSKAYINIAKQL